MGNLLTEVFRGELRHESGGKESFAVSLAFTVPHVEADSDGDRVSASIPGGTVEWDYLGLPARITRGTIAFFTSGKSAYEAIVYQFEFSCEGAVYSFAGEKRFHPGGDAAQDLATIHASVRTGNRDLASGPLSSPLKEMLTGYEAGAEEQLEPSADLGAFHDFFNRRLSALYRHLPPLLTTQRGLSDGLWRTLALLAKVMLPTPLPDDGPSIPDVVDGIARFMNNGSGKTLQTIRTLLKIISLSIPVLELELEKIREQVSAVFASEKDTLIREALTGIHQIVVFAYYANQNADEMLGYCRPKHLPSHRTSLPVTGAIPNRVFDVVIAGTGPAGSLLADRLSAAGKSVLLLEAGPYIPEQTITNDELDSISRLYKNSGLQSAKSSSVTVLQGACVGGGGVVNNGIFFPLAEATLQGWHDAGFPFDGETLGGAYRAVALDLNIGDIQGKAVRLNPAGTFLEGPQGLGPFRRLRPGPSRRDSIA